MSSTITKTNWSELQQSFCVVNNCKHHALDACNYDDIIYKWPTKSRSHRFPQIYYGTRDNGQKLLFETHRDSLRFCDSCTYCMDAHWTFEKILRKMHWPSIAEYLLTPYCVRCDADRMLCCSIRMNEPTIPNNILLDPTNQQIKSALGLPDSFPDTWPLDFETKDYNARLASCGRLVTEIFNHNWIPNTLKIIFLKQLSQCTILKFDIFCFDLVNGQRIY